MKRKIIIASAVMALAGISAIADVVYVDATHGAGGNTFATGSTQADTSWLELNNSSGITNDVWRLRNFGTGGTVYQAGVNNYVSMPELTTQFTIADAGTYDIWGFFYVRPGTPAEDWNASMSITGSPVDPADTYTFTTPGVVAASTLTYNGPAPVTAPVAGDITLYAVNLGEVTVGAGATQTMQIDKLAGLADANRTWYDGVGYEAVPEPATISLIGLFGGLMIFVRSKLRI